MDFFHTTEFYVILFVAAASVVALMVKPKNHMEATEYLIAGDLEADEDDARVDIDCRDDGTVILSRSGIEGVGQSGAVSVKVEVKGYDVTVYERLTLSTDTETVTARFVLDFLAHERYYIRYESEATSTSASFSFQNEPGYHSGRLLKN